MSRRLCDVEKGGNQMRVATTFPIRAQYYLSIYTSATHTDMAWCEFVCARGSQGCTGLLLACRHRPDIMRIWCCNAVQNQFPSYGNFNCKYLCTSNALVHSTVVVCHFRSRYAILTHFYIHSCIVCDFVLFSLYVFVSLFVLFSRIFFSHIPCDVIPI